MATVLVVDEADLPKLVRLNLSLDGHRVVMAADWEATVRRLATKLRVSSGPRLIALARQGTLSEGRQLSSGS